MRKEILIVLIIILIGLVFDLGYRFLYRNEIPNKIEEITETPPAGEKTSINKKVNLSGEIKKITEDTLTLASQEGDLEVFINTETEIFNVNPTEGEDGIVRPVLKKINFDNIKVGEKISISAEKENEKITAISIIVQ